MMLTPEQQEMITSSLWVVNTVLKKLGLRGNKDLKQDTIAFMCRCVQKYDPSKNVKWETYAYKSVYLDLKRKMARGIIHSQKKYQYAKLCEEEICCSEYENEHNEWVLSKYQELLSICTPEEQEILELRKEGYTVKEISETLNCSISKICDAIRKVKLKARESMSDDR